MKNLFLALSFMLVCVFTLASNPNSNVTDNALVKECGFTVTFQDDYGSYSYFEDCNNDGWTSWGDFLNQILDWLDYGSPLGTP